MLSLLLIPDDALCNSPAKFSRFVLFVSPSFSRIREEISLQRRKEMENKVLTISSLSFQFLAEVFSFYAPNIHI